MKIVHVVDSLSRGGQETFLVNLAVEQKSVGHEVIIVALDIGGVLEEVAIDNGIIVECIPASSLSTFAIIKHLKLLMKTITPDIIHTHNRRPLFLAFLSSPLECMKIVNTRHGNGVRGLYWSIAAIFARKIINVSEDLYTESNWVNKFLLRNKNVVIKNGIIIGEHINEGKFTNQLIMVGRLNYVKNHIFALHILQRCLQRGEDVFLTIVGDGEERNLIESEIRKLNIEDRVCLLGDRSDVVELLLASDVFLMTSLSEGHSIALLEACAAGVPAIVSNVGGNVEIIHNNQTGFVVDLNNIDGFVDAIGKLTKDRTLWKQFSKSTREWVIDNASMKRCGIDYEKVYKK